MSGFAIIPEQPEEVPGRPVAWVIACTVLVIVTCAVVVWTLGAFGLSSSRRVETTRSESAPPAQPFSTALPMEQSRDTKHSALDHWTWADGSHQRVRMPVDAAIDRYLRLRGGR